jgi:hypothetical protein
MYSAINKEGLKMKKYISPEVALIKELSNDFCEGLEASVTDSKLMGYDQ